MAACAQWPEAIALQDGNSHVTYSELERKTAELGMALTHAGVDSEAVVAVYISRSIDLVVAFLAVMRVGGVFLPIDPTYESLRTIRIIEDARPRILITRKQGSVPRANIPLDIIEYDADTFHLGRKPAELLNIVALEANVAYVTYTSGSTGNPKGVQISHSNLAGFVSMYTAKYGIGVGDRTAMYASPGFDGSICEIVPAIASGATIVIVPDDVRNDPQSLLNWISDNEITYCFLTTAIVDKLLQLNWPDKITLRNLMTGGEVLRFPRGLRLPCEIGNHYGPTETTVIMMAHSVDCNDDYPPIGKPLQNATVYVLNSKLQLVSTGTVGELYIGGNCVGRGYIHQPGFTASRYIADPFSDGNGQRLYRTGDVVREDINGDLHFIRRIDDQVKLRGFRIEPREIEEVCKLNEYIQSTAVVENAGQIFLFYVSAAGSADQCEQLLPGYLRENLPQYMFPSKIVQLDEMPLNHSAKIDRGALRRIASCMASNGNGAMARPKPPAGTELLDAITMIWMRILERESVDPATNFFEAGGHSLQIQEVRDQLEEFLGKEVAMVTLFQYPTIEKLAAHLHGSDRIKE